MRLLLDTHTFLWFVADDPNLSAAAKALIEDPNNERWLSISQAIAENLIIVSADVEFDAYPIIRRW